MKSMSSRRGGRVGSVVRKAAAANPQLAPARLAAACRPVVELLEDRRLLAGVATDKDDYAFGSTVQIAGTAFNAGETVEFQVQHAAGTAGSNDDPQNQAWQVTDG